MSSFTKGEKVLCKLCQKYNHRMKPLIQMKVSHHHIYEWLCTSESAVTDHSMICLPCIKYIQHNMGKENFHPRWKGKCSEKMKCAIKDCEADVYKHTSLVNVTKLEQLLQERVQGYTIGDCDQTIALCEEHNRRMYLYLNSVRPCDCCGEKPRTNETFNHHCASPDIVNRHLENISSESSNLSASSIVCSNCYKYFLAISRQENTQSTTSEQSPSLNALETMLSQKVQELSSKAQNIGKEEYIEMIMYQAAQTVLAAMKTNEAMLLLKLYKNFISDIHVKSKKYPSLNLGNTSQPSCRWVLSRLHAMFGDSLTVVCKHARYGTNLFYRQCDLVKALSTALGRQFKPDTPHEKSEALPCEGAIENSMDTQIKNVAVQIRQFMSRQKN